MTTFEIYHIIFLVFFYQQYQRKLFMSYVGFTVLKIYSICDRIFSLIFFFCCYMVILFVSNKQNILILFKLNHLCGKKTHVKNYLISFFYIFNRFFLVLKVLYEKNYSTKGAAQRSSNSFHLIIIWIFENFNFDCTKF